jgi:hypothetical protein
MTRAYEPDPEVIADLQFRSQTERDPSRTRGANYDWRAPEVIGKWKCRNRACSTLCDVTEDTMARWADSNAMCERRGWPRIETHEVLVCDRCKLLLADKLCDKRKAQREQTATLIQRLKASSSPRNERGIVEQLEKLGHPDIVGLLEALEGKSSTRKGKAHL